MRSSTAYKSHIGQVNAHAFSPPALHIITHHYQYVIRHPLLRRVIIYNFSPRHAAREGHNNTVSSPSLLFFHCLKSCRREKVEILTATTHTRGLPPRRAGWEKSRKMPSSPGRRAPRTPSFSFSLCCHAGLPFQKQTFITVDVPVNKCQ